MVANAQGTSQQKAVRPKFQTKEEVITRPVLAEFKKKIDTSMTLKEVE
jgi:hypothetical protein